jgi:hypothetical protein
LTGRYPSISETVTLLVYRYRQYPSARGVEVRLAMPDGACVGVSVEGTQTGRTTSYDGRIVNADNPRHIRALRELGCFPVNLGGRPTGGYRCTSCSFRGYFATCGRCGASCAKV